MQKEKKDEFRNDSYIPLLNPVVTFVSHSPDPSYKNSAYVVCAELDATAS